MGNFTQFDVDDVECQECPNFEPCQRAHDEWVRQGEPDLNAPLRYKDGDKVVIRDDLEVGEFYGLDQFIEPMAPDRGQVRTVTEAGNGKYWFKESANRRQELRSQMHPMQLQTMEAMHGPMPDFIGWNFTEQMIDHEKTAQLSLNGEII